MNEFDQFINELGGVRPIKSEPLVKVNRSTKVDSDTLAYKRKNAASEDLTDPNPLTTEEVQLVKPDDVIEFKKDGVQQGVYKNVRLAKYDIHSTLNLHGKSVKSARSELYRFITDAHKNDLRFLLIQHGTGAKAQPHPGMLKSYLNQWLRHLSPVLAFHTAQPFHGGLGATYVLLKKSDDARLHNKERHQKRGANF